MAENMYSPDFFKRLAEAAKWFGQTPGVNTPAGVVPPVAPAAPPIAPVAIARMGSQLPTFGPVARGLGALLKRSVPVVGPAIGGIGEVTGMVDSAADPEQTGVQTATRVAEGVSRLAGMGAGAGRGFAGGGPWGAAAGGALGYAVPAGALALRDMFRGGASPEAKPAVAPVAASSDVTIDGVTYTPQALQALQAALRAPRDWGSFPNANPVPAAAPVAPAAPAESEYIVPPVNYGGGYGGGMLGGFIQGAMGMKYNAGVEARKMSAKKLDMTAAQLLLDQQTKGATTQKTQLESAAWAERLWLAGMESDPAKRAALIGGHALPTPPAAQVPLGIQPMTPDPKNPIVNMWDPVTHTAQSIPIRPVQRVATISEAIADAKRNGKYTSPQQVRRDAEKLGVRITD